MKCLVVILAIGLLLTSFTGSTILNTEVMKLCESDFLHKLVQLCANAKPQHRRQYDLSQISRGHDNSNRPKKKNNQRSSDKSKIQPEFNYGQEPFYNDYHQYEQTPDEVHKSDFEIKEISEVQSSLLQRFARNGLSGTELADKCCLKGCTANDILQYCRP
ncbi:hypothetical protein chiPu_0003997 [Chiloscyllium punctatum]|uniref:Insulin-like 3 n=1 Tax=Chiloscyllium punctatum TaxID=137246 RepID=A0A401S5C0_CHIPU|nr:hypothetical protein [Chiloscyllium punctatum]